MFKGWCATGRGQTVQAHCRFGREPYQPKLEDEILPQPAHFLEAYRALMKV